MGNNGVNGRTALQHAAVENE